MGKGWGGGGEKQVVHTLNIHEARVRLENVNPRDTRTHRTALCAPHIDFEGSQKGVGGRDTIYKKAAYTAVDNLCVSGPDRALSRPHANPIPHARSRP